jgi:hypothetical protein
MKLIETKTLGSNAASIVFTSIPQTFTDLVILVSLRGSRSGTTADELILRFNSTTSTYSGRRLEGTGTGASSTTTTEFGRFPAATATASTFGNQAIYIPNYTSSLQKSFSVDSVTEHNGSASYQTLVAGLWSGTAAITSVSFLPLFDPFVAGSTISLYGRLKGSDGITTAS